MAIEAGYALPEAEVFASDISADALEVANINLIQNNMQGKVKFIQSDLFNELPSKTFDVIISNPPYVPWDRKDELPLEYNHEPDLALFADDDGLSLVDKIIKQSKHWLSPNGILVIEVGEMYDEFQKRYNELPFISLDFERGGEGVFLIFAKDL
jgi:ribosomal protein L3 glutamine methyltransferase